MWPTGMERKLKPRDQAPSSSYKFADGTFIAFRKDPGFEPPDDEVLVAYIRLFNLSIPRPSEGGELGIIIFFPFSPLVISFNSNTAFDIMQCPRSRIHN